jgi:methionyl-tRNA formyltransferase
VAQAPVRRLRVAFAGTPAFAARALEAIAAAGYPLVGTLTQPDRPAGRGLAVQPSEVKQVAERLGAPVAQPRSLRLDGRWPDEAAAAREELAAWAPDVLVVAAYGLILPAWTLGLPRLGAVNIHASLLPRWRGAAPIHRAIEAGDAETGITIMRMDKGLDTGPMLLREALPIADEESTGALHDRLAALGARLIVEGLDGLEAGSLLPLEQPADGATYARKVDKAEAVLDWRAPAEVLARRVRAFDPVPGAATRWRGELLKVWSAQALPAGATAPAHRADVEDGPPGRVVAVGSAGIDIACGDGSRLRLLRLQRAGGRPVDAAAFLAGHAMQIGEQLG